jgi:apolipoprotein N-acyltransferase
MEAPATLMEEKSRNAPLRTAPAPLPGAALRPDVAVWPVRLALLGASLASAGLLWLAYFPVAWGWLGWVALVPLMLLLRARETARFLFLCGLLAGVAFFVPALWWMHAADGLRDSFLSIGPMTAAAYALALYCALYVPVALSLLRRLDRSVPLPLFLTLPIVWTALEFFRSFFGTGFPWYFLGHTQHDYLAVIQVADLGGAYVVSFLVAAVNAIAFEWLYLCPALRGTFSLREPSAGRPWRRCVLQTAAVAGLLGASLLYGTWRLSQNNFVEGPRLALLQGNLDQRLRNQATNDRTQKSLEARKKISHHFGDLCVEAARQKPRPDLIVWPETSFPADWIETSKAAQQQIFNAWDNDVKAKFWYLKAELARDELRRVSEECGTSLLLGLLTKKLVDLEKNPVGYNSALLVTAGGATGGRYDKIHRVPFGEYIPLREWLPFMERFSPYDFDYSVRQGEHLTRFQLGEHHFGVLVCYEDSDPKLARQYGCAGPDGPAADFLVNISNDGWFNGTAEHEQHLAICRFRAIESRRSIARAVNMGISAIIDGNGRVLAPESVVSYDPKVPLWEIAPEDGRFSELPASRWADFKKVSAVLVASVPLDGRTSLYSLWGDWLPCGCWLVVGACLATGLWRRRQER